MNNGVGILKICIETTYSYSNIANRGVLAQMVERSLSMREVLGSMPRYSMCFATVLSYSIKNF